MLIFLRKAKASTTPGCYSLSGLDLGAARTGIVARTVAFCTSLTTLHLCRKNIQDKEGMDLARALLTNTSLRKLELEGNVLGNQTARVLALALKKNKTLRYLDLESNDLTRMGEENTGVEEMIQALIHNKTLLSLNMANNGLDEQIGRQFCDLFNPKRSNQETIIDFEFGFNQFRLEEVSRYRRKIA
jgi:Ran GTPase-activating protein (RanGAP) involved in mRNA processing and transport